MDFVKSENLDILAQYFIDYVRLEVKSYNLFKPREFNLTLYTFN